MKANRFNKSLPCTLILALLCLCACSTTRVYNAEELTQQHQWRAQILETPQLDFMSFSAPPENENAIHETLYVYIEGDGQAWTTPSQASFDPTPNNAIGLGLAIQHLGDNAVYLARPCQYLTNTTHLKNCNQALWTEGRYSALAVSATHHAILQLKAAHGATSLVLIGYSGGGTLAAFIAARETSVSQLITVAAPLDHKAWTEFHRVSPLSSSLTIDSYEDDLAKVPQIHFTGSSDRIVPSQLTQTWLAKLKRNYPSAPIHVIEVDGADHNCCWVEKWLDLSERFFKKSENQTNSSQSNPSS